MPSLRRSRWSALLSSSANRRPMRALQLLGLAGLAAAAPQVALREPEGEDSTCDGPVVKLEGSAEAIQQAVDAAASVWLHKTTAATLNLRPGQLATIQAIDGLTNVTVTIPDLEALVAEQAGKRAQNWTVADSIATRCAGTQLTSDSKLCGVHADPFFDEYREIEMIHLYMEALALEHPTLALYIPSVGDSYEGRNIPALQIGGK